MRVLWYFQRSRNWNNEVQRDDLYSIQDALKQFSSSSWYGNSCDSSGFHTRDFRLCFRLRHKFLHTWNITRWRNNCALLSVSLSRLKFSSLFVCSLFNLGSAYDPDSEPRCIPEKKKKSRSHLYAWNQADKKAKACWRSRGLGREITATLKGKRVWKLEVKLMNPSQEREREWRRKGGGVKFWKHSRCDEGRRYNYFKIRSSVKRRDYISKRLRNYLFIGNDFILSLFYPLTARIKNTV